LDTKSVSRHFRVLLPFVLLGLQGMVGSAGLFSDRMK